MTNEESGNTEMTVEEENVVPEDIKHQQDPKRFDLVERLRGRDYPEETVTVFLDERAMYMYARAAEAKDRNPADESLQKAVDEFTESLADIKYEVTVKGVPTHVLESITESNLKKFPVKRDGSGYAIPNSKADDEFDQELWEAYVVRIVDPEGAEANLTPEVIREFRRVAPQASVSAINDAITELRNLSRSGYEQAVQSLDFLSQR